MSKGTSLVEAVHARALSGVSVWLLGNAGVLAGTPDTVVAIDPWTSSWLETASEDNPEPVVRTRPSRIDSATLASLVDVVLVTHEHPDHLDPGLGRELAGSGIPVVVPDGCIDVAVDLGYERSAVQGITVGESRHIRDLEIEALAVPHAFASSDFGHYREWVDDNGRHHAVGYVLRCGGRTLFHGGDLVMRRGLDAELRRRGVDTCLLPVNGRDWLREQQGLVGNLDARESADLAAAAGASVLVPIHYDGVVGNTGSPGAAVDYADRTYPDLTVAVPGLRGLHLPDPAASLDV